MLHVLQLVFIIVAIGQKTKKECDADQRRHDQYIGDRFRVQHIVMQGVDGFHSCILVQLVSRIQCEQKLINWRPR